jgi:hypothetical protein
VLSRSPACRFESSTVKAIWAVLVGGRFTALADWNGGLVAREAKELVLSAWYWEMPKRSGTGIFINAP